MENKSINWLFDNASTLEVIDVRSPNEFEEGHLPNAKNVPIFAAMFNPEEYFSKDETYYLYCHSGARVTRIIDKIKLLGYKVINCEGVISLKDRELIKEN